MTDAEQALDACQQFEFLDGLGQEVVRAGFNAALHITQFIEGRDHDNWNGPRGGVALEFLANLEPTHAGHHDVQEYEVGFFGLNLSQRIQPVHRGHEATAQVFEERHQELLVLGVIVHNEDRRGFELGFRQVGQRGRVRAGGWGACHDQNDKSKVVQPKVREAGVTGAMDYNPAMRTPLVYETHMHTPLCRHAVGEPEEYAATAVRRGLAGMIVTCHNAMPESYGHSGRMTESQVDEYRAMVQRCAETYAGRLDVRLGLECDFYPGYESYVEKQIASLPLNYAIGSIHPQLAIWRRMYGAGPAAETQAHYFNLIATAAESRLFDCISHPDLIKNMVGEAWAFDRVSGEVARCLDRIAATGVAMELNTSGRLKAVPEMNPTPRMLAMMKDRSIPVVVGADAHVPFRVSDHFEQAYDRLEEAGYTHVSCFLERKRREIPIALARASLRPDPVSAAELAAFRGE